MPPALTEGLFDLLDKLFYCKIILNSTLRICHPISGRVDATRCSKLKGGFPPVPPTLTEGLEMVWWLVVFSPSLLFGKPSRAELFDKAS